jgi:hypothetical protein
MSMLRRIVPVVLAFGMALLVTTSCDDGDCPTCPDPEECPECPDSLPPEPTLENLWPNADSTAWTYLLAEYLWEDSVRTGPYENEEDVPPPPSLDEIVVRLNTDVIPNTAEEVRAIYRLRFEGEITTESGAQAQLLRETIYGEDSTYPVLKADELPWTFLQRLAQVRPDLRGEIRARGVPLDVEDSDLEYPPLYLHGYAFTKTMDYIGGYGDVDTDLSWKFLESDISPGHEFVFQLVPGLADDVFLHSRILGQVDFRTEAGTFENCVECLYMIDYGISEATDEQGNPLGYFTYHDYGTIVYAPTVGPIYSYEWRPPLGPFLDEPLGLAVALEIDLVGTSAP